LLFSTFASTRFALAQITSVQQKDSLACERVFSFALDHRLSRSPIGEVMAAVGKQFIGAPYEAHTLDSAKTEHLVVNLRGFDCVTLVENALALSRCIKSGHLTTPDFRKELQNIRYRGGSISGYASRLHYFTDWIRDNAAKGNVTDVTKKLG